MEKPPGRTLEEARDIREHAAKTGARVMVSMNRRFDPAIVSADKGRSGRPLHHIRAVQWRNNRREADFLCSTGIHVVDAMRYLAGEVRNFQSNVRRVEGVLWYQVQLEFTCGAMGSLEVLPSCGCVAERYELAGPDYHIRTGTGEADRGVTETWEDGKRVQVDEPAKGMPLHVRNGSYAETCAFIECLKNGQKPWPSVNDVWPSVDLCHRIHQLALSQLVD